MNVTTFDLPGLLVIEPKVFGDARGWFMEAWNESRYAAHGVTGPFAQDNVSCSTRGVLRGLHFQNPNAQGKLVSVLQGEVFDVAVDLRRGSPTFRQWRGLSLSSDNRKQVFVPPGFAHGFQVVSESALFHYKCTGSYAPKNEWTIRWDDPDLAIDWPVKAPVVSDKDRAGFVLRDLPAEGFFP